MRSVRRPAGFGRDPLGERQEVTVFIKQPERPGSEEARRGRPRPDPVSSSRVVCGESQERRGNSQCRPICGAPRPIAGVPCGPGAMSPSLSTMMSTNRTLYAPPRYRRICGEVEILPLAHFEAAIQRPGRQRERVFSRTHRGGQLEVSRRRRVIFAMVSCVR